MNERAAIPHSPSNLIKLKTEKELRMMIYGKRIEINVENTSGILLEECQAELVPQATCDGEGFNN